MPDMDQAIGQLKSGLLSPFPITVLLFLAALLCAEIAVRCLRVPRIVSLIVAGAAVGWLRGVAGMASLTPPPGSLLEVLALVLTFEVGQRVPLAWLRKNPWLLVTSLGECGLTFAAVLSLLTWIYQLALVEALFVSVVCMAASPIVVMCVSKELATRGQIAERALLLSTLSSVYAVLAMQFLLSGYLAASHAAADRTVEPLLQLFGCFLLGAVAAGLLRLYVLLTQATGAMLTIGIVCFCLLLYAISPTLGLSPLLGALFFGLIVRATDRSQSLLAHQTSEAGVLLAIAYFVLLGASLQWSGSVAIVGMAIAVSILRLIAKIGANAWLASAAALHPARGVLVGLALAPLSSLALILATSLAQHPGLKQAAALAQTVVLLMAVLGPLMTEVALRWAREPTR